MHNKIQLKKKKLVLPQVHLSSLNIVLYVDETQR